MRRKNNGSLVVLVLLVAFISAVVYVFNSSVFERDVPEIKIANNNGFWNLRTPLDLTINDQSGIKRYSVILRTSKGDKELTSSSFITPSKNLKTQIEAPRSAYTIRDKEVSIIVKAVDASKWNFFNGNEVEKIYNFTIDKKRPHISVIANSYKISKGGAALVIFKATDKNLDKVYIKTNFDKVFKVTSFYKEGYYISLLAWPVTQRHFRADIYAVDFA